MGRVIRAQRQGPSLVPAEVYSARIEAQAIRERAAREAAAIRSLAQEQGYAAGQAAAAKLLCELSQAQAELLARTQREATQAVLLVAAQLLGQTLASQPEQILQLLAPHLTRMRRAQQIVLRLHPDDAGWLDAHSQAFAALRKQQLIEGQVALQHDPSITRGGCVIESSLGDLDARVETRLGLLAEALGLEPDRVQTP